MNITAQGLVKFSGKKKVIDHLSFHLGEGGTLGIYGKSGSGKTLLMQMLAGATSPDEGEILYDGNAFPPDAAILKKKIGYLPQSNPLYPGMRILDFLLFLARLYQLNGAGYARVEKIISLCGLENEKSKTIRELSQGCKQRLGIAQVLIHDPDLLLLDEPVHGLDPRQTQELLSILKTVGEHKTMIVSSGEWSNIARLCPRMISFSAPPEEKFTQEEEEEEEENVLFNFPEE